MEKALRILPLVLLVVGVLWSASSSSAKKTNDNVIPSFEVTTNQPLPKNKSGTCGRERDNLVFQPLVYNGNTTQRSQFPWLTPIFRIVDEDLQFLCGGSLISTSAVISAAHCFRYPKPLEAHQIVVFLGRHNLENDEENFLKRELKTLHIHPEYEPEYFSDADLAILQLISPVIFTEFIQPICLWSESSDLSRIVGKQGVVVGWGSDETGRNFLNVPKMVNTNIVSEITCRQSRPQFNKLTSSRTFCAGNRDGSGPCTGDSGSGLMIEHDGYWMLRGIVSAGLKKPFRCQLEEYVVYCDLAKHIEWVNEIVFGTTTTMKRPFFIPPRLGDAPINVICGREGEKSDSTQLSAYSNDTNVVGGQFPWLTAIFENIHAHRQIFICGGTLISTRTVLTAAHCFNDVAVNRAVVNMGRHNLSDNEFYETRDIKTLHIHPEYNQNDYNANIAIIELMSPVRFNQFIQPICLWAESTNATLFGNETGVIVGWDTNGNYTYDLPEMVNIDVITEEQCHNLNPALEQLTSSHNFCIFNKNGTVFGKGAYGFMIKRDGRWVLRGIVAQGWQKFLPDLSGKIGLAIISDVAKHIQWIQQNTLS